MTNAVSESTVRAAHDVRVVFSRLLRRLRETYDPSELTPSQMSVLSRLDKQGTASVSELAGAERVRHQSMASIVGTLAERGLVVRRADPQDGRRQLVSVSDAGEQVFAERRTASEQWLTRALQDQFTEAERGKIIETMALLERLARS